MPGFLKVLASRTLVAGFSTSLLARANKYYNCNSWQLLPQSACIDMYSIAICTLFLLSIQVTPIV
jgi:hypothetical protein